MDENQKAAALAATVAAVSANEAIIRLAMLLAQKGFLSDAELETFRHFHLRPFDDTLSAIPNGAVRKSVHEAHDRLDRLWQAAIQGWQQR